MLSPAPLFVKEPGFFFFVCVDAFIKLIILNRSLPHSLFLPGLSEAAEFF